MKQVRENTKINNRNKEIVQKIKQTQQKKTHYAELQKKIELMQEKKDQLSFTLDKIQ